MMVGSKKPSKRHVRGRTRPKRWRTRNFGTLFSTDYLTRVVHHLTKEVLPSRYGESFLQNQQISYVITVPAIWSDKAKDLTRQAAIAAGIPRKKLTLITEPEAAALFCASLCQEVDLKEGDRFLICDAGGGTVVRPPSQPISDFP